MAASPRTAGSVDADELGRREFTRNRKGWDPVEVRAHLLLMADEIKRLQSAEAGLRSELTSLRAQAPEPEELDESKLTRLLGEETARVLEAARLAATEIRTKAEESAARLVREAQEQATRLSRDAEELRSAAAREADELVGAARVRADEMVAEARESAEASRAEAEAEGSAVRERAAKAAEELRSEAEAEAERLRSNAQAAKTEADEYAVRIRRDADDQAAAVKSAAEATASELRLEAEAVVERMRSDAADAARQRADEANRAAEVEIDVAREQGRAMVQEAREARERMLRDLAERRKVARQQLEALRAGRERLLDAFRSVRTAFDDATEELVESLPAARTAADEAARAVDDDIDAVVAELDESIAASESAEPGPLPEFSATFGSASEEIVEDVDQAAGSGAETTEAEAAAAAAAATGADEPAAVEDVEPFHPAGGEEGVEVPSDLTPSAGHDEVSGSRLRLVPGGGEDMIDEDEDDDLDDDLDLDDTEGGSSDASVEAIFARIRAGQQGDEDEEDDGPDGPDAVIISLESERVEVAIPSETTLEVVEDLHEEPNLLDRRDDALAAAERVVSRRLKRALSDQENSVLHTVRGNRKARTVDELLGTAHDRAVALAKAAGDELVTAVTAGAGFFSDEEHTVAVDAIAEAGGLSDRVDEWLSGPLRLDLERVIEEGDVSGDRSELAEQVRSVYREWKGDRLAEVCGDLVTLAFNRGILASASAGATHCWLVDHGGLPCADAEDNHLAGAVACGEQFPTGHVQPPAHPGCRCLLAPPT